MERKQIKNFKDINIASSERDGFGWRHAQLGAHARDGSTNHTAQKGLVSTVQAWRHVHELFCWNARAS